MSTGSITDVLSRVSQIEQQIQSLSDGSMLDQVLGVNGNGTTGSTDTTDSSSSSSSGSSSDFSSALAQAQGTTSGATSTDSSIGTTGSDGGTSLANTAGGSGATTTSALTAQASLASATGVTNSGATVPASASSLLTSSQQQFASALSADTGLNPSVVSAWVLSEESGNAAQERQAAGNNDWLNVGYTDSATYGAGDTVWSDPVSAANATATWLQGQDSIPGYGTASSGIQAILQTVGQTPASQLQALQQSGWSSGGYPNIDSLYAQVTGSAASS